MADNQLDEASETLDALAARKLHPAEGFEADYWRGELAQLRQKYPDAVKFYRTVTDDPKAFPDPLVAQAWFGLGNTYQKMGDHDKAMAAFEQAFTLGAGEQLRLASFRLYLRAPGPAATPRSASAAPRFREERPLPRHRLRRPFRNRLQSSREQCGR